MSGGVRREKKRARNESADKDCTGWGGDVQLTSQLIFRRSGGQKLRKGDGRVDGRTPKKGPTK